MSADWQVGDLALCVDARPNPEFGPPEIKEGRVYVVAEVTEPAPCLLYGDRKDVGLILSGIQSDAGLGFAHERFRKIRPDEHEACEPEFVTLLKRRKVPLTRETAEQIRRWRQEDADNGIVWEDSTKGRERQRFGDNPLPSDR